MNQTQVGELIHSNFMPFGCELVSLPTSIRSEIERSFEYMHQAGVGEPIYFSYHQLFRYAPVFQAASSETEPEPSSSEVESAWESTTSTADVIQQLEAEGQFEQEVLNSLALDPVEDGCCHPAEEILVRALRRSSLASDWIQILFRDRIHRKLYNTAADLMLCVGRLPRSLVMPWGLYMVASALKIKDLELREAAVRSLECWGGGEEKELLSSHTEPVRWLAGYIQKVLRAISTS